MSRFVAGFSCAFPDARQSAASAAATALLTRTSGKPPGRRSPFMRASPAASAIRRLIEQLFQPGDEGAGCLCVRVRSIERRGPARLLEAPDLGQYPRELLRLPW